jgi:hypothetical protein
MTIGITTPHPNLHLTKSRVFWTTHLHSKPLIYMLKASGCLEAKDIIVSVFSIILSHYAVSIMAMTKDTITGTANVLMYIQYLAIPTTTVI